MSKQFNVSNIALAAEVPSNCWTRSSPRLSRKAPWLNLWPARAAVALMNRVR